MPRSFVQSCAQSPNEIVNQLPTAVFLDRDGTIVEDRHYMSRPDDIHMIDGAPAAIARINAAMIPAIVITNQSGIGRGYFTSDDYENVTDRLSVLLAASGARIDRWYHCPHAPDAQCDCRKPGKALFDRAAKDDPSIDLSRSLYIGDRWRDLEAGISAGGWGVLIPRVDTPADDIHQAGQMARIAPSLGVALDWYLCVN